MRFFIFLLFPFFMSQPSITYTFALETSSEHILLTALFTGIQTVGHRTLSALCKKNKYHVSLPKIGNIALSPTEIIPRLYVNLFLLFTIGLEDRKLNNDEIFLHRTTLAGLYIAEELCRLYIHNNKVFSLWIKKQIPNKQLQAIVRGFPEYLVSLIKWNTFHYISGEKTFLVLVPLTL